MDQKSKGEKKRHRAVSPVIGVILMVAITVILAAVIGTFVLEIGDRQETAPSTSFDFDEESIFMDLTNNANDCSSTPAGCWDLQHVTVTHAGGDVLSTENVRILHDGRNSAWGLPDGQIKNAGPTSYRVTTYPVLICESRGSTDATWQSGSLESVLTSSSVDGGGPLPDNRAAEPFLPEHPNLGDASYWNVVSGSFPGHPCRYTLQYRGSPGSDGYGLWTSMCAAGCSDRADAEFSHYLEKGDTISVRWQGSSGATTQVLSRYTVQSTSAGGGAG